MLLASADVAACANPEYPESLFLDTHHIQGLQNEIHLIVLTASCIYQIKETVSNATQGLGVWPATPAQVEDLKNAVMQSLNSPIQPMAQLQMVAQQFAVNCMHLAKKEMSPEDLKKYAEHVAANAASIALPENPVVPLLKKRLEKAMMNALVDVEDVSILDSMKLVPANKCFSTFDEQIQKAFEKIVAICNLNFAVFYGRYRDLLKPSD
eukprot:TRINITY_DN4730_c0_g1_i3.p1 TRINITY_DN4730_c0_g1~~TRINITY_DN4730_c0_g1_i3.p1  ORF type:complete len:209 (+),score=47.89 TRINITY_DN4730_c0_g1_i3:283-909(+)